MKSFANFKLDRQGLEAGSRPNRLKDDCLTDQFCLFVYLVYFVVLTP